MTDFTPASRPSEPMSEEPLLDSFLREAIPEIKLALGDLIDRDNSRAIPDKYVKLLPLTTLVVTLRPDAAQAVAPMAADLEADLTDSVMRHGSLYDRDYRVRLKEAGQRGAPLFRVGVQPAGQPEPAPIVPAPPPAPEPPASTAYDPAPPVPPVAPVAETLFAGRSPEFVDPDATRIEGIGPAREMPPLDASRYTLVVEDEDGTERERFPLAEGTTTVGRQTDNPALASDIQLTGSASVSRRQLVLVHARQDGAEGFIVYNLGLNAIHVGDREVSGANAGKGPLQLEGMDAHSTFVRPGESIRIGGHGPVVRVEETAKDAPSPAPVDEVEEDPDRTQFG